MRLPQRFAHSLSSLDEAGEISPGVKNGLRQSLYDDGVEQVGRHKGLSE